MVQGLTFEISGYNRSSKVHKPYISSNTVIDISIPTQKRWILFKKISYEKLFKFFFNKTKNRKKLGQFFF